MMIGFCKKSVHSFFNLHNTTTTTTTADHYNVPAPGKCGLGLIAGSTELPRPRNVIDRLAPTPPVKKDPGGVGFLDEIGGSSHGLTSCTESLGFESSVETKFDDDFADDQVKEVAPTWRSNGDQKRRREKKKFPPPLSSLNCDGRPSFYLRPVRRDGRLELTEVRMERPKILRAHREDGRLRLQLVREDCFDVKEDEIEHVEEEEEEEEEGEERSEVEVEVEVEEKEGGEGSEEELCWRHKEVRGEGARRCEEVARMMSDGHDYRHHHHHHHHNNLHVWVTTR